MITDVNRVIVVPSREARETAIQFGVYACQNHRQFQPGEWIAFYFDNQIDLYARIIHVEHDVLLSQKLGIQAYLEWRSKKNINNHVVNSVRWLTDVTRIDPIKNDSISDQGRRTAWCQNTRYTTIEKLRAAKSTSDLE